MSVLEQPQSHAYPIVTDSFGLVISNDVTERVGDHSAQLQHLLEIARVLRPDGIGYLPVPNRWALRELYYRLRLLSWLPNRFSHLYVTFSGKGETYDCLLSCPVTIRHLIRKVGLSYQNVSTTAVKSLVRVDNPA